MTVNNSIEKKEERPVLCLIQEIKDGTLNPKTLTREVRRRCVEFLYSEGYAETGIARILDRNERTIRRDLNEIRECNALPPNVNLAKQIIGDMLLKAKTHHTYLMRLARTSDASVAEKTGAELSAWRVQKELIDKLQSLGYLPLRPQEIVGDLFHHFNDENKEKSFAEVRDELSKVIEVAQECGTLTPELEQNVNTLNQKIEKAQIVHQVEKLSEQTTEQKEASDER